MKLTMDETRKIASTIMSCEDAVHFAVCIDWVRDLITRGRMGIHHIHYLMNHFDAVDGKVQIDGLHKRGADTCINLSLKLSMTYLSALRCGGHNKELKEMKGNGATSFWR